jgi:hypothetical protein
MWSQWVQNITRLIPAIPAGGLWFKRSSLPKLGVVRGRETELVRVAPITGKRVDPGTINMVLFHGNCPDGMAAAFAAYRRLGDTVVYIGIEHGINTTLPEEVDGQNVAILDFSFNTKIMAELEARSRSCIVLDHHHSAMTSLEEVAESDKVFEMKMSGCTIAWDFFHGDEPVPLLFRYLEDKDIWRWALHNSKEFSAGQSAELPVGVGTVNPAVFAKWDEVLNGGDAALRTIINIGKNIIQYEDTIIKPLVRGAQLRRLKLAPTEAAYFTNSTVLASRVGNALAERGREEGVGYAIVGVYNAKGRRWNLSLRSLFGRKDAPDASDVAEIAKRYGGGGHQAAAGLCVEVENIEDIFM